MLTQLELAARGGLIVNSTQTLNRKSVLTTGYEIHIRTDPGVTGSTHEWLNRQTTDPFTAFTGTVTSLEVAARFGELINVANGVSGYTLLGFTGNSDNSTIMYRDPDNKTWVDRFRTL